MKNWSNDPEIVIKVGTNDQPLFSSWLNNLPKITITENEALKIGNCIFPNVRGYHIYPETADGMTLINIQFYAKDIHIEGHTNYYLPDCLNTEEVVPTIMKKMQKNLDDKTII